MSEQQDRLYRSYKVLASALGLELPPSPKMKGAQAANEPSYSGFSPEDFDRNCPDGERTQHLLRVAGYVIGQGGSVRLATDICLRWNVHLDAPLPEEKIRSSVASVARTHARNNPSKPSGDYPLFDLAAASVARFIECEAPERDWVFVDCMPMGKAGAVVGTGGTGKSQFALGLAYDLATGRQRYSPWRPAKARKVFFLSAEDDEEELHRRFRRLACEDLEADNTEVLRLLSENLRIVSRVGEDNLITREDNREVVQTDFIDRLVKTLESAGEVGLIVIDPISRFRGGDENAAQDTTRFVEAVEKLVKLTGAALLLVHHSNKASSASGEVTQHAARGSSALVDGLRLVINLSVVLQRPPRDSGATPQLVMVKMTKTNYSRLHEPTLLIRKDDGRLVPVDPQDAVEVREGAQFDLLVATLKDEIAAGRRYSKSKFASEFGGEAGTFAMGQAAIKGLIDRAVSTGRLMVEPGKTKYVGLVDHQRAS